MFCVLIPSSKHGMFHLVGKASGFSVHLYNFYLKYRFEDAVLVQYYSMCCKPSRCTQYNHSGAELDCSCPQTDSVNRGSASSCESVARCRHDDLYPSPNIIRLIKSKSVRWAGYVARMGGIQGFLGKAIRKKTTRKTEK